jgi:hypothetical protein
MKEAALRPRTQATRVGSKEWLRNHSTYMKTQYLVINQPGFRELC